MIEPKFAVQMSLVGLSLAGLGCSLYFAISVRKPKTYVCRNGTCIKIADTPYARVFGIQNWQLGILFYLLTVTASLSWHPSLIWSVAVFSAVSALVSVYLAYALTFKLKVVCVVCYIAQAVNLAIFGLWLWSLV